MAQLTTSEGFMVSVDRPGDGSINIHLDATDDATAIPTVRLFVNDRLVAGNEEG